jgi:UDPglucose--hexose-1-phosphate uridylyltransferase
MEYRRNLLTREWVVYGPEIFEPETFLAMAKCYDSVSDLFDDNSLDCPYCPANIPETHIDIFSARQEDIPIGGFPVEKGIHTDDWDIKVLPSPRPVFKVETSLKRFPKRLHDVMIAPGAHEKFILTSTHGVALWDFHSRHIELMLQILRQRMMNLYRDTRLGHQHAYIVFGKEYGSLYGHSVLNLTAAPFVPLKIQRELDGAFQWYRMKERCLFGDIREEELYKRETGKAHGIIHDSSNFVALTPFFSGHPFELWIMPLDHYSDFTHIPVRILPELANVILQVMKALRKALGNRPFLISFMNQPNENWGRERGYWKTIQQDWLWRLRIVPNVAINNSPLKAFHTGTGVRLNPVLPENAARYLRSHISLF